MSALLLTIGLIVWLSSRAKVHPFMALLLATIGLGLVVGLPGAEILQAIQAGFGGLMGYIGLIVVLGSIIGVVLERSGGALRIATAMLDLFGRGRPALAMTLIGAVVGIPVFCDSGFIILSRLNQVLATRTGRPPASLALGLAAGLYTTHTLVPPTPGPIAAAGNLGATDYLGTIILLGLAMAVPTALAAWAFARWQGARLQPRLPEIAAPADPAALPPLALALGPILLPVLLIALASISSLLGWEGRLGAVLAFAGSPLMALLLGTLLAGALLPRWDEAHLSGWVGEGIRQAGPILVLTGAGGAFGSLLKATPLADYVASWAGEGALTGAGFLVLTFLIAALLKTAQGSSTSALVITSSMMAPLVETAGFTSPLALALVVMAVGGGAMTVSHANDSYFWVVSQFSGLSLRDAYRGFSLMTLLQGLVVLGLTLLVYLLFL